MRGASLRWLALKLGFACALCGVGAACSGDRRDIGPLALYEGEPNGDAALLVGTLVMEGECLYVDDGSTRYFVGFSEQGTR